MKTLHAEATAPAGSSPVSPTGNEPAGIAEAPPARPAPVRHWRRRASLLVVVAAVLAPLVGGLAWFLGHGRSSSRAELRTHAVHYEKLQPVIATRGDLESAEHSDIVCRVRSWVPNSIFATTIKSVIADGSQVKRGELLVELDSSGLEENLKTRKGPLALAQSDAVQAEENCKIVESQVASDTASAEVALQLAALDLRKYLQGDFEQARKDVESRLKMAESDLDMWDERVSWLERMVRKGYASATQVSAEQGRQKSARVTRDGAQEELRVLEKYTRKRTVTDLEGKVTSARLAVTTAKSQARAKLALADADRLAKQATYANLLGRYREIEDEIKKCTLTSPQDGLVVYEIPSQVKRGAGSQTSIIAQGEPVREGQVLMRIPNVSKMQVHVRIHEALVAQVHGDVWRPTGFGERMQAALLATPNAAAGLLAVRAWDELDGRFHEFDQLLVSPGQPARIRVAGYPERTFRGHVKQVAQVAGYIPNAPDIRIYDAQVAIDEPIEGLRQDMSAEVAIFADEAAKPALAVPVQALVHVPEQGNHAVCFVQTPEGMEEREVVVGAHTDDLAEVQAGLQEGDEVVLNPQPLRAERDRAAGENREETESR